jgi:hypothetical protein
MSLVPAAALLVLLLPQAPPAQPAMPPPFQQALADLGRPGDFRDGVLKVNLGRSDLKVTINGRAVPTAIGFGGWVAFTQGDMNMTVLMGDLVLTEDQVNPVMSALLDNGLIFSGRLRVCSTCTCMGTAISPTSRAR